MTRRWVVRVGFDYLGRLSLDAPLQPVPFPFAYTWEDRAAADAVAEEHDGMTEMMT